MKKLAGFAAFPTLLGVMFAILIAGGGAFYLIQKDPLVETMPIPNVEAHPKSAVTEPKPTTELKSAPVVQKRPEINETPTTPPGAVSAPKTNCAPERQPKEFPGLCPITGESDSFFAISISSYFADTEGNVYYVWTDTSGGGLLVNMPRLRSLVRGADVQTFKNFGDNYGSDATHVYYAGEVLTDADAETFLAVIRYCTGGGIFGKDKNHIFQKGKILPDVDPATFIGEPYTTYRFIEC
jgi:hypothetical protein